MTTPNVVVDFSGEGIVVIERDSGSGVYDNPSREIAELEREGVLDIQGENGCRMVIGKPNGEDTFHESDYVNLIASCIVLVSDMYDVEAYKVIEAVERCILGEKPNG